MTEVYELELDDQRDPRNYGLFSSMKKVEKYLEEVLGVDLEKDVSYNGSTVIFYRNSSGIYVVSRRSVR